MGTPKLGKSKNGKDMHYSVGALIKRDSKYLLIDRMILPLGIAGPAGHIDEGETPEQALIREVEEETGLKVEGYKKLYEEELDWNWCSKGIGVHYWHLFACEVSGKIKRSYNETRSVDWYHLEKVKEFKLKNLLEPVWDYWFKKLDLI